MTDPLKRQLSDLVDEATPTLLPPFAEIQRRARRQRIRDGVAVAASAAVVAGIAWGGWALSSSPAGPGPEQPATSPSATGTTTRSDPTFDPADEDMSGIVVRLPDGDLGLRADERGWPGNELTYRARLRTPDVALDDLGSRDTVEFWFARPGWSFSAVFQQVGEECPRHTTVDAVRTDDQWFRLDPADQAGEYVVDLYGDGPEGRVSTRFHWTTTSDGPLDEPTGQVALFPASLGNGSYAVEVTIADLPFQPDRSEVSRTAQVTVTGSDGTQRTLAVGGVDPTFCWEGRGSFYYQQEWRRDFSELGQEPFEIEVELVIRGTTYVGTATWSRATPDDVPLTFTPPLPGA